jgi:hypothetical protein
MFLTLKVGGAPFALQGADFGCGMSLEFWCFEFRHPMGGSNDE